MGTSIQPTSETIRFWRRARVAYFIALAAIFAAVAFYFDPNYMLFGRLTPITPDDFKENAMVYVAPLVRAIKEYAVDHGQLPPRDRDLEDYLVPQYLPPPPPERRRYFVSLQANGIVGYLDRSNWNHYIQYDLNPEGEGWYVRGAFTSGPIDLPLVTIDPARRTTSRPATQPR